MRMKIAVVIMQCEKDRSSRYVGEVTRYFADAGHEVHVFTNKWDELDGRVKVHKIPSLPLGFDINELVFTFLAALIMKFKKFDVTMAQATRYFRPDVCYMQFVYKKWADMNGRDTLRDRLISRVEHDNLVKSRGIIAMSNVVKNEIISSHGIPAGKINVVYSGVNLDLFRPVSRQQKREIRKELGIPENDIVLVFAGNPYRRKGLEYLIRALPDVKTKNFKLLIMGKDMGEDRLENYMDIAKDLNVADKIVYGGFKPDVYKYFASADLFVFPTLYEPFGLVILEALAAGLPVITSRCAGAAEVVDNGKNGFLLDDPKDFKDISDKINMVLESGLIESMGIAARKKAENYKWGNTAKEMLKVLESAVGRMTYNRS